MKCKNCGQEFVGLFSDICPFCGADNSVSLFDTIFGLPPQNQPSGPSKKAHDPYDWDDPDNCSEREYMDDDDYDEP